MVNCVLPILFHYTTLENEDTYVGNTPRRAGTWQVYPRLRDEIFFLFHRLAQFTAGLPSGPQRHLASTSAVSIEVTEDKQEERYKKRGPAAIFLYRLLAFLPHHLHLFTASYACLVPTSLPRRCLLHRSISITSHKPHCQESIIILNHVRRHTRHHHIDEDLQRLRTSNYTCRLKWEGFAHKVLIKANRKSLSHGKQLASPAYNIRVPNSEVYK